ncbi:MAG: exoenzyme S synthesis protein B [Marinilabiliaceae bacterium]|nr:exoenzyme S synthesis protein B [Marinilabiliaceae bacterium]
MLINYFSNIRKGYLLFSGGLDSVSVLGAALKAGTDIIPVWVNNGFNRCSFDEINQQALNIGASNLIEIVVEPDNTVRNNPVNRCYYCKKQIINSVENCDFPLFDGTTACDNNNYRPGKKALNEAGVISPLAELGITKSISNKLAVRYGADTKIASKESCLATRFNYNQQILDDRLFAIATIEKRIIHELGDYNVRCRFDDPDHIRIELGNESVFFKILNTVLLRNIVDIGKQVAKFVTIDMESSRPNEHDKYINK